MKVNTVCFLIILIFVIFFSVHPDKYNSIPEGLESRQSCSILYSSDDSTVLAGNNEDWNNPFTKIWFLPAENGLHGRVYFGFDSFMPQGGMNDQGLFFDAAVAEKVIVPSDPDKTTFKGSLILKAMAECASAEEVLAMFQKYDVQGSWNGHYLIGDRFGDSAIIEPMNIIRKEGRYQIATNFYQSKNNPAETTCERYRIARKLLETEEPISVDLFRNILDAVHYESEAGAETLYSNIYDLKKGIVYLYHFHNFHNRVSINLEKELKKGIHYYDLPSLFPETFAHGRYIKKKREQFENLLYEKGIIKSIPPEVIDQYLGQYDVPAEMELPECSKIELKKAGNHLVMLIDTKYNLKLYKLYPRSETDFFHIYSDGGNYFTISLADRAPGERIKFLLEDDDRKFTLIQIKH